MKTCRFWINITFAAFGVSALAPSAQALPFVPPIPAPPPAAAPAAPPAALPAAPAPAHVAPPAAAPAHVAPPAAASPAPATTSGLPAQAVAIPAAPPPHPSASKQAEARLHFQQAVALYQERNYDAALAEFQGAYGASGEPIVLYNLGLTFKALFRYGDAVEALDRYLSESRARGQTLSAERRAEVAKNVAEMKSLLADVTIVVRPPDAVVRIDGRPVTMGIEGIVKLGAGTHTVDGSANDYTSDRRDITVVAGTPQTVSLMLVAIPHTGHVKITAAQIGARVSLDGRDQGPAPIELELPAGGHQMEVTAPGYQPDRSELAVAAGQSRELTVSLNLPQVQTQPFYHRWWFWTGVAVAVVAVGTIALWPRTQDPLSGTLGTTNGDP
jgi:hypothetical protein